MPRMYKRETGEAGSASRSRRPGSAHSALSRHAFFLAMSLTRYVQPRLRDRLLQGKVPEWLQKHPRSPYIIAVCLASPPWVSRSALYALRDKARAETIRTGHLHVLAHIVPVTHPKVCGLTVPWNLEIKHWRKNLSEGNRWDENSLTQLALDFPRQHTLFD